MILTLKKLDTYIIAVLIFISVILMYFQSENRATVVLIEVDGSLFATYGLTENREILVKTQFGENKIIIEDRSVFVSESSCKDKLEVKEGSITKSGQSLICLPNRLVVSLKGDVSTDVDTY